MVFHVKQPLILELESVIENMEQYKVPRETMDLIGALARNLSDLYKKFI